MPSHPMFRSCSSCEYYSPIKNIRKTMKPRGLCLRISWDSIFDHLHIPSETTFIIGSYRFVDGVKRLIVRLTVINNYGCEEFNYD